LTPKGPLKKDFFSYKKKIKFDVLFLNQSFFGNFIPSPDF
jgi:hypothetical protein